MEIVSTIKLPIVITYSLAFAILDHKTLIFAVQRIELNQDMLLANMLPVALSADRVFPLVSARWVPSSFPAMVRCSLAVFA